MCYHVSIDGCNILLDCGWNDKFDVDMLKPLAAIAPKVDAVLICLLYTSPSPRDS